MLQNIRDHSTSWFSWIIIGAIIIVFALFGITRYLEGGAAENNIATVNGVGISQMEASNAYYQLRSQAQQNKTFQSTQQFASALKKQALQQIIHTQALLQSAEANGFILAPVIIQAAVESLPAFQDKGQFSPQKWQAFVSNNPNANQIIQQIKNSELLNQVRQGFVGSAFILPGALKQMKSFVFQKRQISYVNVPFDRFKNVTVTPEQEKAYYQSHLAEFSTPEEVKIAYLTLSVKSLMQHIHPTQSDLQAFYQENITHYQDPQKWLLDKVVIPVDQDASPKVVATAREKAGDIVRKLEKGGDFEAVTKAYQGVQMPWVSDRNIGPELKRALAELPKVGSVSMPLRTDQGYVVYQLKAQKAAKQLPFDQVKSRLIAAYRQQKAQQQFENDTDQLANLTFSEPDSLKPAAKALNLPIQTSAYFSKQGEAKGIFANPDVVQTAFSNDVLTNRNNSQILNIDNNTQVVLRVQDYKPKATKSFKSVKPQIQTILLEQAKIQKAKALAQSLVAAIQKDHISLDKLSSQHGLSVKSLGYVSRDAKSAHPNVISAAFAMPLSEKAQVVPSDNAFEVVMVSGAKPGKVSAKEAASFDQGLQAQQGELSYALYAQNVFDSAKVKIEDPSWK